MTNTEQHSYRNPWHNPNKIDASYGPEFFTTPIRPLTYRGFQIFHPHADRWDAVFNGICVGQRAGKDGAKWLIDLLLGKKPKNGSAELFWYERAVGYLDEASKNLLAKATEA